MLECNLLQLRKAWFFKSCSGASLIETTTAILNRVKE